MSDVWADAGDGELLSRLSEVTGAMMFIVSLAPKTLWVNDELVRRTGYSFEDYQFQRFENPFIPVEDATRVYEFLKEFLATDAGVSEVIRNRFVDRWGVTLYVRSRITKVLWKGERALLYTTFADPAGAEKEVDVNERFRSLVDAATDSIVRVTPAFEIAYSNRCFQLLTGRTPLQLSHLRFTDLVAPDQREAVRRQLSSSTDHVSMTIPLALGDDTATWLEGTFVKIRVGEDAGMFQAVLRDTTEKRRLDARVHQIQKRETLGQMAGGIAHDLNNILTGILASATLAEQASSRGEPIGEALASVRLAARRAGELSTSMLAYAGEGSFAREPVDVAHLVGEMRPLLSSALPKNVELRVSVPDQRVVVLADAIQLRQVVMNLIFNAADASRAGGGQIEVTAGTRDAGNARGEPGQIFGEPPKPGPVAFVRVEDRGFGMSPAVIAMIFDPFFSTKARGRGLGLAAVLGILGRHGGCVRVQSQVGVGTSMEIWLPLSDAAPRPARGTRALAPGTAAGVVLLVDDEGLIRRTIRRALESLGYTVLEAETGEVAVAVLAQRTAPVDAVVLDETMPGMGGTKTLAAIRADFPTLPVVRTSGYSADTAAHANDAYTHFLGKPYAVQELAEALQRALKPERG